MRTYSTDVRRYIFAAVLSSLGLLWGCAPSSPTYLTINVCLKDKQGVSDFLGLLQSIAVSEHLQLVDVITEPNGETPASWGDAFVVAPDGSRAGIVWQAEGEPSPVVCSPSPGRWGVYAFRFQRPVRNEQDLIENLHAVLPQLKAFYAAALVEHP